MVTAVYGNFSFPLFIMVLPTPKTFVSLLAEADIFSSHNKGKYEGNFKPNFKQQFFSKQSTESKINI